MGIPFVNRTDELGRLSRLFESDEPGFAVLYGRRRCGKSTLLRQLVREADVYYLADQQEPALQRADFATEIGRSLPGFDSSIHPTWDALFTALGARVKPGMRVFIDELPYLVRKSPELPSVLQKVLDRRRLGCHLVLCGSSQRMMHDAVLAHSAPLYGRAAEILDVRPMGPEWLAAALGLDGAGTVERFAVVGGVPRYWELLEQVRDLDRFCREVVLSRNGVLHDEPRRLLAEDIGAATEAHSLLALVGRGVNRASELAARMGKPVTSLGRSLALLVDLGLVTRRCPFGENPGSSKRSLYRLADPFLQFWYRLVHPALSLLEQDLVGAVWERSRTELVGHVAAVWEELARLSTARLSLAGRQWMPGAAWWGNDEEGRPLEIDVVAESLDGRRLLVGEAKWERRTDVVAAGLRLEETVARFLGKRRKGRWDEVVPALFCRHPTGRRPETLVVVGPDEVCGLGSRG